MTTDKLIEALKKLGCSPVSHKARRWVPLVDVIELIYQHQAEEQVSGYSVMTDRQMIERLRDALNRMVNATMYKDHPAESEFAIEVLENASDHIEAYEATKPACSEYSEYAGGSGSPDSCGPAEDSRATTAATKTSAEGISSGYSVNDITVALKASGLSHWAWTGISRYNLSPEENASDLHSLMLDRAAKMVAKVLQKPESQPREISDNDIVVIQLDAMARTLAQWANHDNDKPPAWPTVGVLRSWISIIIQARELISQQNAVAAGEMRVVEDDQLESVSDWEIARALYADTFQYPIDKAEEWTKLIVGPNWLQSENYKRMARKCREALKARGLVITNRPPVPVSVSLEAAAKKISMVDDGGYDSPNKIVCGMPRWMHYLDHAKTCAEAWGLRWK